MASEIKLPELGEGLTSGAVVDVKVAAGDTVSAGQALLEVEAEKSTLEVPSPLAGRISKLLVQKGDSVQVGKTFCVIETDSAQKIEDTKPAHGGEGSPTPTPQAPQKDNAAQTTATPGDKPKDTSALKNAAPAPSRSSERGSKPAETPAGSPRTEPEQPGAHSNKLVPAGPATRRLARELGIDLTQVAGSGSGGRVDEEDVKAFVRSMAAGGGQSGGSAVQAPALPDFAKWGPVNNRPLDGVRRKTAEQMSLSWRLIPHVTQHDLADITDLDAFRRRQETGGAKLTVTAFALKAVSLALRQFPQFNASLDLANNQLVLKEYYHIGVAVDTERGLLVPVIRDVDKRSIFQLAQDLAETAERARQKKISIEEMRGGTFTITNLGGIGGIGFSPIINYPELAILGLSRSKLTPVVKDGQIVPRLLLPLSLSYDHRALDGADAARFTRRIAQLLESPLEMLLHI